VFRKLSQSRLTLWIMIIASLAIGATLIFVGIQYSRSNFSSQTLISSALPQSEPAPAEASATPSDKGLPVAPITTPQSQVGIQSAVTAVPKSDTQVSKAPTPTAIQPSEPKTPSFLYDIQQLPIPPRDAEKTFVEFMQKTRNEDRHFLSLRYKRCVSLIKNQDLWRDKEIKAFLLTPRERFCIRQTLGHAYDRTFLDIGFGQTISGPYLVGRMTSVLDVLPGEKVLEIGTGSGYQSAILSHLTQYVYTIEIVPPLAARADQHYEEMTKSHYPEFGNIVRKCDDGYYGWPEHAPFDKIIVTCGIDHIPPELLKELKIGGTMIIPVGPPGAQVVLKVTKNLDQENNLVIAREDIYQGKKKVPFVPFIKKGGSTWSM
jgi:protein-L-isoaspartate(D-aspartate) O-methyltransferase